MTVMELNFSVNTAELNSALAIYILLLTYYCMGSSEIQSKSYHHTLDNGDLITCMKCSPGFFLIGDCTSDGGNASCRSCPDGTFNSDFTIARACAPCSTECQSPKREYIAKNCTPVSNISCLCREGYYRDQGQFGLCLAINPCPPGQGVVKQAYSLADTECEDCPPGYFSANTSTTELCQECSKCLEGTVQDQDCRSYSDRTCKSPDADALPVEAVIGGVIAVVVIIVVVTLLCCFCVMKERCARVRKQLFKCCHRPYEECTTRDESTNLNDIQVNMPNVPDVIPNTNREQAPGVSNSLFFKLREDLISEEYPQFFRLLFTNGADLYISEMKFNYHNHGVKEVIYQLLVKWRDIEKENAKPENILEALEEWGRQDLVQKYTDIFNQNSTQCDERHRNNSKSSLSTDV